MSSCCPICTSPNPAQLDARDDVPILMNRLYLSAVDGRQAARGPLALTGCRDCGFVWNAAFKPELIVYDAAYENDQTHSPAFSRHVLDRAQDIVVSIQAGEPLDFLEVGCGQGRFIEEIAKTAGSRLRSADGFDPAWRGEDGKGPGSARIHTYYFDKTTAKQLQQQPNAVATRHTIEHVPDPVGFLSAIREALGPDSHATIFVETPCVEWILRNEAMQDFFYEHCSLFTAESLAAALHRAGFADAKVQHVFGGQYLWANAKASGVSTKIEQRHDPRPALEGIRRRFVAKWRQDVAVKGAKGGVALWGAGAKGVNFSLMVDPGAATLDHVIDINPAKQGKYLPGTGLKVLSPETSAPRNVKTIYVMNPNYMQEISEAASKAGIAAEFIPIN